jgi:ribosomal protein S18 acetylase RimI-like enzyme
MALRYNIKNNIDIKTYIYFKPTESNNLDDIKLLLENDDKIVVYPNNEDVNQYNSYKNVTDYIYRINKIGFLCKGLNPDYILDSFDNVDAVVIIGSSINILPNGNIFGFALIKFDEETNSIYIDVICSHTGIKGAGDILINEIEEISRRLFIEKIRLTSVDTAISFYEKYGFTKIESLCDDMCVMIKYINKKIGGKRKTNKQRKIIKFKKTRKNRRLKCKKV